MHLSNFTFGVPINVQKLLDTNEIFSVYLMIHIWYCFHRRGYETVRKLSN